MFKTLALATLGVLAGSAGAATLTENIDFSLANFVDLYAIGVTSPVLAIDGSFTVSYDPTKTYEDDTTDLVVHSLTGATSDSTLGFSYAKGQLQFGGIATDAEVAAPGTTDVIVAFDVADPAHPTLLPCSTPGYFCGVKTGDSGVDIAGYTLAGVQTGWFATASDVTGSSSVTSVPEPTNVALLGLGLAAFGLARQRRRR